MSLVHFFETLSVGTIVNIAGAGYREGVPAKEADAGWPLGVVRRLNGDLVVVDYLANRLWRIDRDGILHAFAGDGIGGHSGDGGPAMEARFSASPTISARTVPETSICPIWGITRFAGSTLKAEQSPRVAGVGRRGRGGDGGPAIEARARLYKRGCGGRRGQHFSIR